MDRSFDIFHHHPEEWGHHAQQLDRSADYGYGYGDRDRFSDDRERYRRGLERSDSWRHEGDPQEHSRYHQGMSSMSGMEEADVWREPHHPVPPSLWQRVKGAFSGKGPKNYVRSDERIHEDVCEALTHHPYVDASDIEVTVRDGEVTLTGTVDARIVKRAAEDACDHVRGVQDVHNHLRVRRPEPSPSTGPST